MPPNSDVSGTSPAKTSDWVAFVVAKIELVVTLIRDKAISPINKAAHYLILGLMTMVIGTVLAILFGVGIIRVLDNEVFHRNVWASYLVVAGIFTLIGMLCVWLRKPRN